ncbi:MAG: fibrillarin-like rRNA/tRNA 2'-O-methyltransferase, partial [Candidatus Bathyarchaeota archaeon]
MSPIEVMPHEKFADLYWTCQENESRRLATLNFAPGKTVYGERLLRFKGDKEYRAWNPYRSKL